MAIYHCQIKPLSRGSGRSAIAAAAYRAGVKLHDERSGIIHDYCRRSGVVDASLFLPDGLHALPAERNQLWNAAEATEKRKDARTAREYEIALPCELSEEKRCYLAWSFASELANRYGVAVDVAVHHPSEDGDIRNHHAHLLATTRKIQRAADGSLCFGEKASIELSDKKRRELGLSAASDEVKAIRQLWEQMTNQYLAEEGRLARIDSRSLKAQGIEREPTRHLGPTASAIERRTGQASRRRLGLSGDESGELQQKSRTVKKEISRLESALSDAQGLREDLRHGVQRALNQYQQEKRRREAVEAKRLAEEAKRLEQERAKREALERSESRGYRR